MKSTVIIDTPFSNKGSAYSWLKRCHLDPLLSSNKSDILNSSVLVFPGNGTFSETMTWLQQQDLHSCIRSKIICPNTLFIGICIGMQIAYTYGFEGGRTQGLNILEGTVEKLSIPRIGWDTVDYAFNELSFKSSFYFMHSYGVCLPNNQVAKYNSFSNTHLLQFHPEKSGENGEIFLKMILDRVDV